MVYLKKLPNMTDEQYLWQVGLKVDSGEYDNWESVLDMVNKELLGNEVDKYKGESAWRKKYQTAKKFYNNCFSNMESKEYKQQVDSMTREIEKSRKKLQTEKLEYNRWLREDARDEMITERIVDAISKLKPLQYPNYIENKYNENFYLLCFADAHYGIEFDIKDMFGETINSYSPEIFNERMEELLYRTIKIINKEKITELNVWDLGDGIQGIIRLNSQLLKLRYGIIESTMMYANYLSDWLNRLSEYVRVKFQMVIDSNHNQLRICSAPKNSFPEENMSKVMIEFIRERLKDNPNITIIENPTGMNHMSAWGYNILGIHGEQRNLATSADEFSRSYGVPIDYIIGGHKHHSESKEIGIDSEAISIRSIIGVDPYGMSLNKTSNAGCSLFSFGEDGLNQEYKIKFY